jgi:hypothetical protein
VPRVPAGERYDLKIETIRKPRLLALDFFSEFSASSAAKKAIHHAKDDP